MTDLFTAAVGPIDAPVTLVFVHGPGLDHTHFRPFVDPLGDTYRLLFYDARLCGGSPRSSPRPVSLDVLAEDLRDVMELSTGAIVIVAHSFAPAVPLTLNQILPHRMAGMVFVAPGLTPTVGQTLMQYVTTRGTSAQQAAMQAAFAGGLKTDEQLASAWETVLPLYFGGTVSQAARAVFRQIRFSAVSFNTILSQLSHVDWLQLVATVPVPLLVIAGSEDWIETDPSGGSRAVAHAAKRGEYVQLACGHFPYIEQPDAFASAVRTWVAARISTKTHAQFEAG